MVWIGEKEITMSRGWVVQFKDGSVICEDDMPWIKVPNKKNIRRMCLKWEDRLYSIDNKENYIVPQIRGYYDVNSAGGISKGVHSRTIGYYDLDSSCKVFMRVDENTGRMSLETEPIT